MSYKRLNLNRSLIEKELESSGVSFSGPERKGNNEVHYIIEIEGGDNALLVFYFNKDGTTSISALGKNTEKGNEIAAIVKSNCLYSDKKSVELFIKIEESDFCTVVEYLIEESPAEEVERKDISGGTQIKLVGACGNLLVIKYYTKRGAMQIQGKPLSLYDDLIEILCELLPFDSIVGSQLKQINVDVKAADIRNELQARIPLAYDFLDEKVRAIISPSLALNKLAIELDDYTAFAMPVLRGMEGYLKLLFSDKGLRVEQSFGEYIDGSGSAPVVKSATKTAIACSDTVEAIESCYAYWADNRHGLFHVDGETALSRTLDRQGADGIINSSLSLIEGSYSKIHR